MRVEAKGFDFNYLLDLLFDFLDLFNTILDVLRNFGEFLSGN
jgi:hypothetical protein